KATHTRSVHVALLAMTSTYLPAFFFRPTVPLFLAPGGPSNSSIISPVFAAATGVDTRPGGADAGGSGGVGAPVGGAGDGGGLIDGGAELPPSAAGGGAVAAGG